MTSLKNKIMPRASKQAKRRRPSTPTAINHTESIDLSSDLAFLTPNEVYSFTNILLRFLISGRITSTSFSDLYERSKQTSWEQVLIEERRNLSSNVKSKSKRLILNRLIKECSQDADTFKQQTDALNEQIEHHMSDVISHEHNLHLNVENIYAEIEAWRKLQRERHLFYTGRGQLHSLLSLQRLLTDHFINLINLGNVEESSIRDAIIQLFQHALIIVAEPSSSECVAMTKYEKVGKDYLAKIKTRIICMLDPHIVQQYLNLSDVNVTLYPMDRGIDIEGDIQSSLQWKTRTVTSKDKNERTFLYAELSEKESIQLTKLNLDSKLLYNKQLCQLVFRTKIELIGKNIGDTLVMHSQPFGICSHAKHFPKYLTKVFTEKVNEMYSEVILETHLNTLKGYICQFHSRISGVEAKPHTEQFIEDELLKIYRSFQQSTESIDGPVMIFSWSIYEDILEKLFIQMKFLDNHPFLSIMYHESLFLGICNETVDGMINQGTEDVPLVLLRFEKQQTTDYPKIIFATHRGELRKSCITHGSFIDDMCKCICEAAENRTNQAQLFDFDRIVSFQNLSWFYDTDLSQPNVIQNTDGTHLYSLNFLLRNTMQTNRGNQLAPIASHISNPTTSDDRSHVFLPTYNDQLNIMHTFTLEGHTLGNSELVANAINALQVYFLQWCNVNNVRGSLTDMTLMASTDLFDGIDITLPTSSISPKDDFEMLLRYDDA